MLQPKALAVVNEVRKAILGKDAVVCKVLMAILARGHILLEDNPGVGKTTLALAFSKAMGLEVQPGTVHPRGDARRRGGLLRVGQGHGEFLLPAGGRAVQPVFGR